MFPVMLGFPASRIRRILPCVFVVVGNGIFGGCAGPNEVSSVKSTRNIAVENQILSYHHRADVPWGAVPVVPSDSDIAVQVMLQAGAFGISEVDGSSVGTWSPSTLQGTTELAITDGNFRGGLGGRLGAAPTMWASIGLLERGEAGAHFYGDFAAGFGFSRSTVDYKGLRTIEESGKTTRDTTFVHERHRRWSGFTRFSLGVLPDHSGPWATVQLIPSWTLLEWPKGYHDVVTTITTTYDDSSHTSDVSHDKTEDGTSLENVLLLSVGAGWTERFGSQTVTVGARYSVKELHQLEMIAQFSTEL